MLLRPRLGLRCGPRLTPADHHPRLPAGGNPDSAVSVRCDRFHFIAPAPTSRRSAGDPSCIPFLLTSATGSSRDREPMTLVPRPLRGSTGIRRLQASASWRPRSLSLASLARWHVGLLHFPQPQELLYFVPPHRPHPLTQDPGALGPRRLPPTPPSIRRPGSLKYNSALWPRKTPGPSPPLLGNPGPRARPGQWPRAGPSGSPHASSLAPPPS